MQKIRVAINQKIKKEERKLLFFAGIARRPMHTNCGNGRYPLPRPGNAFAVVNYCLAHQSCTTYCRGGS